MSSVQSTAYLVPVHLAHRVSVVSYVPHDFLDYLDQVHDQSVYLNKQAEGLYKMSVGSLPVRCMFRLVRHDRARVHSGKPLYWEL